jgi:hypothetical protein
MQLAPDPSVFELLLKERALDATFGSASSASDTKYIMSYDVVAPGSSLTTRFYRAEFMVDCDSPGCLDIPGTFDYASYPYDGMMIYIISSSLVESDIPAISFKYVGSSSAVIMGVMF